MEKETYRPQLNLRLEALAHEWKGLGALDLSVVWLQAILNAPSHYYLELPEDKGRRIELEEIAGGRPLLLVTFLHKLPSETPRAGGYPTNFLQVLFQLASPASTLSTLRAEAFKANVGILRARVDNAGEPIALDAEYCPFRPKRTWLGTSIEWFTPLPSAKRRMLTDVAKQFLSKDHHGAAYRTECTTWTGVKGRIIRKEILEEYWPSPNR